MRTAQAVITAIIYHTFIQGKRYNANRMIREVILTQMIETPIGPLLAGAGPAGVRLLAFNDSPRAQAQLEKVCRRLRADAQPGNSAVLDWLAAEVGEYFNAQRREFSVPLAPNGTEFQQRVWQAVNTIAYGHMKTYAQLAAQIGAPLAYRAVGAANGQNPISILIPCHRLINSAGQLAGYGGGLWRKQYLLALETQKAAVSGRF